MFAEFSAIWDFTLFIVCKVKKLELLYFGKERMIVNQFNH